MIIKILCLIHLHVKSKKEKVQKLMIRILYFTLTYKNVCVCNCMLPLKNARTVMCNQIYVLCGVTLLNLLKSFQIGRCITDCSENMDTLIDKAEIQW
jgi:hypothetical protein